MTDSERELAKDTVRRLRRLFKSRGVTETPLIALRVDDLCASLLLAQRAEDALVRLPTLDPDPSKVVGERAAAAIESAGRARERLRKAMKELEQACAKMGTPVDIGIADRMKPIMRKAAGVIEEMASPRTNPSDPAHPAARSHQSPE